MEQGLLVKVQEQVGGWDVVWEQGGEEWEETVLGQVPVEIVFAPVVGQRFLIKLVLLVII
jgi:hypothetical protein